MAIGSFLQLSSVVTYTKANYIHIRVAAEVRDPKNANSYPTNTFHFTFATPVNVPAVRPETYQEAMWYLQGKRINATTSLNVQ